MNGKLMIEIITSQGKKTCGFELHVKMLDTFFQFSLNCIGEIWAWAFSSPNLFSRLEKLQSRCENSEVFLVF